MNDRGIKTKKHSNANTRVLQHVQSDKNPSSSSIKHLQGHCLPKNPPNIAAYHHYAHPRKQEDAKQNMRCRQNDNRLHSTRDPPKTKNVLLLPRKSNQNEEGLRRTQKKLRKGPTRSQWVSPEEEGLGCHEYLSSQIFRHSGQSGTGQRRSAQARQ